MIDITTLRKGNLILFDHREHGDPNPIQRGIVTEVKDGRVHFQGEFSRTPRRCAEMTLTKDILNKWGIKEYSTTYSKIESGIDPKMLIHRIELSVTEKQTATVIKDYPKYHDSGSVHGFQNLYFDCFGKHLEFKH